jgi:hypothetical protein
VLDFSSLKSEEVPRVMHRHESNLLLDALELSETPVNLLAVSWTFARGEFDGLRVERPVRMAAQGLSVCL